MKTGNTRPFEARHLWTRTPQWSPAMKTGNTEVGDETGYGFCRASMEPGHEDREYSSLAS